MRSLLILLATYLIFLGYLYATVGLPTERAAVRQTEDIVLNQVNHYRAQNGLSPYTTNEGLCSFAAVRAQEAVTDWSHDKFFEYAEEGKLRKGRYIENLQRKNIDFNTIVAAWVSSPTHNENLLADVKYACVRRFEDHWAFEGYSPK